MVITYRFRLKDSSAVWLTQAAKSVNFVWNYCNETSFEAIRNHSKFLSGFDLNYLTAGSSKDLNLNSASIQAVGEEYANKRKQTKKRKLKWRNSKSLGWIPLKASAIKIIDNTIRYNKHVVSFWNSRKIEGSIKSGSFSQDARKRWYINLACEVSLADPAPGGSSIGIDLGLKTLATLSNGEKYQASRYFRKYKRLLGLAQKDGKLKRSKNIHAKIANQRKDEQHKISTSITKSFSLIVIGDVSSSRLTKTKLAVSVLDAGWNSLKSSLKYKAIRRSGKLIEVSEHLTSQTCSSCGIVPPSSPKGLKGLGIREWVCSCGASHDRDVNAAINILRLGHQSLALK